jgi:Na+/proline symporter
MEWSSSLTPGNILLIISVYFLILLFVARLTGKKSDNKIFFTAGRKSPWFLVAFGMIGASLSGVTFISIPGVVGGGGYNQAFSYLQMVMGYLLGYAVISAILLPAYYKLSLTTIYGFLEQRLGFFAYKTGAAYFLLSRVIGASFRLFLVAMVLDQFVFGPMGAPFFLTVMLTILLIWVYTFQGGIKTIVWTDSIQTLSMLGAVAVCVFLITKEMGWGFGDMTREIRDSGLGQVFFTSGGWEDPNNFFKQFISGALITIVMTGLDQDMMQKNLTCKNLREAQLNMGVFSVILFFANLLFLSLGALLYLYAAEKGIEIPTSSDQLFPEIALSHLPSLAGFLFIIGIIAAAYSSADSALTSLTTSFCVDFLNFENRDDWSEREKKTRRWIVHFGFSILLFAVIIIFERFSDEAVIHQLFVAAGYTYGPLLGLFAFAFFMKRRKIQHWGVIAVCIISPVLSYWINSNSAEWLNGFQWGYLILLVNGLICFAGLYILSIFTSKQS